MATKQTTITVDAKLTQAYSSASKAKQKQALSAMRQVLRAVPVPTQSSRLSEQETALFLKINRTLPPAEEQRYSELKHKLEDETLTPAEHAELLRFVEQHQELSVERLEAVLELAKLRGVTTAEMLRQLGVDPDQYAG